MQGHSVKCDAQSTDVPAFLHASPHPTASSAARLTNARPGYEALLRLWAARPNAAPLT